VLRLREDSNVDRTPGRLVVSALISLYLGFACLLGAFALAAWRPPGALPGSILLGSLAGIFGFIWLPLIGLAIIVRLLDRLVTHKPPQ